MQVTVVIPVRDDWEDLQRSLRGLRQQILAPDALVIANSGGAPLPAGTLEGLSARELRVGPRMPGAARNAGAAMVQTEWLAFLDSGAEPLPSWLWAFAQAATAAPEAEVLFGTYTPRIVDDWDWAAVAAYVAPPSTVGLGRAPTTASLCIRRATWVRLGGMPENLRAGEDLLFFDGIAASGTTTALVPGAQVIWDLPSGLGGHFRRLRSYSHATWPTRLSDRWQRPVLRMYLAGVLATIGSLVSYPPLLALLGLLVLARLAKTIVPRRRGLPPRFTPSRLLRVPPMLAAADLATLLGVLDALVPNSRS